MRLLCADCGEVLFGKEDMTPSENDIYLMDYSKTAYQCDCGFIGTPIVERDGASK